MATSKQEGEEQRRNRDLQSDQPVGPHKVGKNVPDSEIEPETRAPDDARGGRQQGGARGG